MGNTTLDFYFETMMCERGDFWVYHEPFGVHLIFVETRYIVSQCGLGVSPSRATGEPVGRLYIGVGCREIVMHTYLRCTQPFALSFYYSEERCDTTRCPEISQLEGGWHTYLQSSQGFKEKENKKMFILKITNI